MVFEAAATKRYVRLVVPAFVSVMFAWLLLRLGAYATDLAPDLGIAGWVMALYAEPVSFGTAGCCAVSSARPLWAGAELNGPSWTIQTELVGSILLLAATPCSGQEQAEPRVVVLLLRLHPVRPNGPTMLNYLALLLGSFIHVFESRLRRVSWLGPACLIVGVIGVSFTHAPPFAILDGIRLPDLRPTVPTRDRPCSILAHRRCAVPRFRRHRIGSGFTLLQYASRSIFGASVRHLPASFPADLFWRFGRHSSANTWDWLFDLFGLFADYASCRDVRAGRDFPTVLWTRHQFGWRTGSPAKYAGHLRPPWIATPSPVGSRSHARALIR